ncbi:MAG: Xaa-Pro aminopeptidase [Saprospiraceae bacterium]|nr:MAG: Xaa-Pro aminopeptidase [Saprospiraceae bacterium]
MFKASIYEKRRSQLTKKIDSGLLLFLGNEESSMNYTDNVYPFRQDSNFLYFFGIDQPHLAAIIDVDEQKTILFGDDFSIEMVVWMGPHPTIAELGKKVGVQHTAPYGELVDYLKKAGSAARDIHFLPPYRPENKIKLHEWLDIPLAALNDQASVPFIKGVVALAGIKSPEEIEEIEKAVDISGLMHISAMKSTQSGIKESQLAGIVEGIAIAAGGRLAYPAIVTVNGQTLHNHYHGNTLKKGQLVLGDFGAETTMHYAGDITRTFPVDATFTQQQKEIYSIVLDAQMKAIEAIKPGVPYLDIHLLASTIIAKGLIALGIMKGDADAAVAAGAHALFFPHGLGHMMGLDVHDMEDLGEQHVGYTESQSRSEQFGLNALRLARPLEPGFVLTVEPGIYFIPELIDSWEAEGRFTDYINYPKLKEYRTFGGVRIEDNILVTESGYRVLGQPIPKTIEEIEALRK